MLSDPLILSFVFCTRKWPLRINHQKIKEPSFFCSLSDIFSPSPSSPICCFDKREELNNGGGSGGGSGGGDGLRFVSRTAAVFWASPPVLDLSFILFAECSLLRDRAVSDPHLHLAQSSERRCRDGRIRKGDAFIPNFFLLAIILMGKD